jgi:hypothetical protein
MHSRVSPIDSRHPIAACGCREFQPNRRSASSVPARSDQPGKTTHAARKGDCAHHIHHGYLRPRSRPSRGLPAVAAVSGTRKDQRVERINGEEPMASDELAADSQ